MRTGGALETGRPVAAKGGVDAEKRVSDLQVKLEEVHLSALDPPALHSFLPPSFPLAPLATTLAYCDAVPSPHTLQPTPANTHKNKPHVSLSLRLVCRYVVFGT